MKHSDIVKLFEAGLISTDQKDRIIEQFELREGGRFLTILSFLGTILIAAGIVLMISANWEEIHRGAKITASLVLMMGSHAAGFYMRSTRRSHPKTGEALHVLGSILFLANIALLGQIYHLSARMPNAFLLWWVGIAALPWILRSKAQHVLLLIGFGIWFGMELNDATSILHVEFPQLRVFFLALLGMIYLGLGYWMRASKISADFSRVTENLGLLTLHIFLFPTTWNWMGFGTDAMSGTELTLRASLVGAGIVLVFAGFKETSLTDQWRWTWKIALATAVGSLAGAFAWNSSLNAGFAEIYWIASFVLAVFCLVQIQTGVQMRSAFMVNVGVVFFAMTILATYIVLLGSMAHTGLMFVISGVFLVGFGIYLEKKRRSMLNRISGQTV